MNDSDSMFMTPAEVAELSGIRTGRRLGNRSMTREQLQADWLRSQGIPFYINARGRPMIIKAVLLGGSSAPPQAKPAWQPRVVRTA